MAEEEDDDDDDEEEDPTNLKDRISELERQRSIQDTQVKSRNLFDGNIYSLFSRLKNCI